jgi:hypothetical protein
MLQELKSHYQNLSLLKILSSEVSLGKKEKVKLKTIDLRKRT